MDEPKENVAELELLAKIHNQLVDLTKMIAEVEMAKTSSEMIKTKLRQVMVSSQHIDAEARSSAPAARQQKVIAPVSDNIEPGAGSK